MEKTQTAAPLSAGEQVAEMLTIPDLAALLRATPSYVYRLRHEGRGPRSIKVGGRVLFRRRDVDAWLERHADDDRA